jgi:uncharacterized protein YndB with AHSA1/START domain
VKVSHLLFGFILVAMFTFDVGADVIAKSPDHYTLRQEAQSSLAPETVWEKLINPATWWHPDHTYSGDSVNLSLDAKAGGLWREDWEGGSVLHGSVLYVSPGKQLRLDAPFGPLQDIAVKVVWTITITPSEEGSTIVFDEIANGTDASKLDALAPAVDFVKTEAIKRLVAE